MTPWKLLCDGLPRILAIPLVPMSPWQDNELRYALRSWELYGNIEEVVIVGYKPEWLQNVTHIPYTLVTSYNKPREIMEKMKLVPAQEFIFANDDHFLLQPITDLPCYYSGPIADVQAKGRYKDYVHTTRSQYPYGNYFDIHVPMKLSKTMLAGLPPKHDILFKSHYCNFYGIKGAQMTDCKIDRHIRDEEIHEAVKGRQFFSLGDNGLSYDMKQFLQYTYPKPSKYEAI